MENRYMNVWSRHVCPARFLLLLPQSCVVQDVIMVFLILWLNDVPIEKSKIVKHCL